MYIGTLHVNREGKKRLPSIRWRHFRRRNQPPRSGRRARPPSSPIPSVVVVMGCSALHVGAGLRNSCSVDGVLRLLPLCTAAGNANATTGHTTGPIALATSPLKWRRPLQTPRIAHRVPRTCPLNPTRLKAVAELLSTPHDATGRCGCICSRYPGEGTKSCRMS